MCGVDVRAVTFRRQRGADDWADPWEEYAALRDHDPVHHVVPAGRPDQDYFVLSRHADVLAAAVDTATFSSALGLTTAYGEIEAIGLAEPPMVMQDPPAYTAFRRLVARGFTPRQVADLEPTVREFVRERLPALADGGDVVEGVEELLDVARRPSQILTFSQGSHHCLGAAAARLQGRAALEELLAAYPDFAVDPAGVTWAPGPYVRRPASVPFVGRP